MHRQSLSADTLAAIERLQARFGETKTFVKQVTMSANLKRAAAASKQKRVLIAHLRHTHITLATECGTLVNPPGVNGVPLEIVAQLVGHHDSRTTRSFYLGNRIPPLITLPISLRHQADPGMVPRGARGGSVRAPVASESQRG